MSHEINNVPGALKYEPTFARARGGVRYRLEYLGERRWRISNRSATASRWTTVGEHTLWSLRSWGDEMRTRGETKMVRALGILMTGSEEKRLRAVGCETRQIASGDFHEEVGGPGHSSVVRISSVAWAELALDGSFKISVSMNHPGWSRQDEDVESGIWTVDDVVACLEGSGMGFYCIDTQALEELVAIREQALQRGANDKDDRSSEC